MSHLDPIFAAWDDNAEAMASDIDEKGVTVRQWRNRRNIPSDRWRKIIAKAKARGFELTLEQFLKPEEAETA